MIETVQFVLIHLVFYTHTHTHTHTLPENEFLLYLLIMKFILEVSSPKMEA